MSSTPEEVRSEVTGRHSTPESLVDASSEDIVVLSSNVRSPTALALDTSLREVSDAWIDRWPIPIVEEAKPLPLWYRTFEKLVAVAALVVFALPMLIIGLIVRLGSAGPALFFQQRVGLGTENFTFVKFRTMFVDARERFPELYSYRYTEEEVQAHFFKVNDDPRLTPQGTWLRKTTLDEIPNFLAVLTGKMSLVGPRPEIPEMLPYYKGKTLRKFSVRPGITGLAQTCGRGNLNFHDTVAYDLEYVEQRSVWLNIKILCKTVKIVLNSNGAF